MWIILVTAIIAVILSFIVGYKWRQSKEHYIGTFVVDHVNPEVNGGVYTIFDVDPMSLKEREIVTLDILIADVASSQQSQGV